MDKQMLFNTITASILGSLEKGCPPWRKSWTGGLPANYVSRKIYQGINFLCLAADLVSSPFYLTFLQAQQNKLRIKKGSKGRVIIFYKIQKYSEFNEREELIEKRFPLMRFSYVFNVEDCEGYTPPEPTLENPKSVLNQIIENHSLVFKHNQARCFYVPGIDMISVPPVNYFQSEQEYFASLFHELIHWSGHPNRLNRPQDFDRSEKVYAFEELIAEIGSSFLCGLCGITNTLDNSSAYLEGWIRIGKMDNSFIPAAAIEAQKAVNFLVGDMGDDKLS